MHDNMKNFVESVNGKLELFRYKLICTLLEEIRRTFVKTIANRFNVAKTWVDYMVHRVKVMLIKTELKSRDFIVALAGKGMLEFLDASTTFTVNLAHISMIAWYGTLRAYLSSTG